MYTSDYMDSELSALTSEPHYPLGHVLLSAAPVLRAFGLTDPAKQKLGQGAFGAAFEIPLGGQSVLKLTRDPTEVQAASLLAGRASERIVPVHGVWYLKESWRPGLRRWYVIHRGYLSPLSAQDRALVEILFALYDDEVLDLTVPKSVKQHGMVSKWREHIRGWLLGGDRSLTDDEGNTYSVGNISTGKATKRALQLLLQIGAAMNEMRTVGIDWEDFHSDNIMRNEQGRLVVADIGWGLLHDDSSVDIGAATVKTVQSHQTAMAQAPAEAVQ